VRIPAKARAYEYSLPRRNKQRTREFQSPFVGHLNMLALTKFVTVASHFEILLQLHTGCGHFLKVLSV
jgi:hypothetical protein